jgi:hypothetical protein
MLHSIEIEIDANGYVHSTEPLPTKRRGILTLLDNPTTTQPTPNAFQDLFGILKANNSASLDDMANVVAQKARERFDDCN